MPYQWNTNAHNELATIFQSPESRFMGSTIPKLERPPLPWNPKVVKNPIWATNPGDLAPNEQPPDAHDEWKNSGKFVEIGRRRYSAYGQFGNRDGPQMAAGIHPSRSSLRPLNSSYVRTIGAHVLEGRVGQAPPIHVGSASELMECSNIGPQIVMQADGTVRRAIGKLPPGGRPFSGYKFMVQTGSQLLEGNVSWTLPKSKKPGVRLNIKGAKSKGRGQEAVMDEIIAEFGDSDSESLGSESD